MGRFIDRLRRPTKDNTANEFMNQVVGNKADAAAAGAATDTDTMVAYIKQLIGQSVSDSDVEAKVDVIDGYHDVPLKDAITDAVMRDVIGRKTDSSAAGAVSEAESLMAYIKQSVTAHIAAAASLVVIDEFHDVPAADNTLNAQINEVIGNKTDAGAAGAVTATDTLVAYIKQLVSAAIVEAAASVADQVDIDAILADTITIGDATLPVAPVAGSLARFVASGGTALGTQLPDSKSLYDMLRSYGEGYLAIKPITLSTAAIPVTEVLFTVTGEVEVAVIGYTDVAVTSSGLLTLEAGVAGTTAGLIALTAVAALTIDKLWIDATPAVLVTKPSVKIIANGADIAHVIRDVAATAGAITYYCWWRPLSADGNVVAA